MLEVIIAGASLAFSIYQLADRKIKDARALEEENRKRLVSLREEIACNLDTIHQINKNDTSAASVYNPVQRRLLESLKCKEIVRAAEDFDLFLQGKLTKEPSVKDPARVFWDIKDSAAKLNDLCVRLERTPKEPVHGAGRILVMRRLPPIQRRLESIDKVLSIIPLSAKGKKK